MAVTITRAELRDALRLSDEQDITTEIDRILGYATVEIDRLAPTAADVISNEAVVRLASYLFDQPSVSRGTAYGNAMRNSGAGSIIAPYRIRRAGNVGTGGDLAGSGNGNGNGIDTVAVQALIDSHAALAEIHHRRPTQLGVIAVDGGRLPAGTGTVMRLGWSNTQDYAEEIFTRDNNHPDDGATVGTIAGTPAPSVQPVLPDIPDVSATEKYLHIWIAEVPGNVVQLTFFNTVAHGVSEIAAQSYLGTEGSWWVSGLPLSAGISAYPFSAIVAGLMIATRQWAMEAFTAHAALPAAHHVKTPPGGGGGVGIGDVLEGNIASGGLWRDTGIAIPSALFFVAQAQGTTYSPSYPIDSSLLPVTTVGGNTSPRIYLPLDEYNDRNTELAKTSDGTLLGRNGNRATNFRVRGLV